jgi:hypothetical protein
MLPIPLRAAEYECVMELDAAAPEFVAVDWSRVEGGLETRRAVLYTMLAGLQRWTVDTLILVPCMLHATRLLEIHVAATAVAAGQGQGQVPIETVMTWACAAAAIADRLVGDGDYMLPSAVVGTPHDSFEYTTLAAMLPHKPEALERVRKILRCHILKSVAEIMQTMHGKIAPHTPLDGIVPWRSGLFTSADCLNMYIATVFVSLCDPGQATYLLQQHSETVLHDELDALALSHQDKETSLATAIRCATAANYPDNWVFRYAEHARANIPPPIAEPQ